MKTLREIWNLAAPPLGAFVVARLLLTLSASAVGVDASQARAWSHWDSHIYLQIAEQRWELVACPVGQARASWCGNAGWMPLYPYIIRVATLFGLNVETAGVLISVLAGVAFLALAARALLCAEVVSAHRQFLVLMLAALFPGMIYQHAVFPISLVLALALLAYSAAAERRGSWRYSGWASALLLPWAYATGVLAAGAPVLGAVVTATPRRLVSTIRQLAAMRVPGSAIGVAVMLGFLSLLLYSQLVLGHWDAFFLIQKQYGHGMFDPLSTLGSRVALLSRGLKKPAQVVPLQSLVVALYVVASLVRVFRKRSSLTQLDCLLVGHMVLYWIFPLMMGPSVSLHRSEALLAPTVLLWRDANPSTLVFLGSTFLVIAWFLSQVFFAGNLV